MHAILTTDHKSKEYHIGYSNAHATKTHVIAKLNLDHTSYAWSEPKSYNTAYIAIT